MDGPFLSTCRSDTDFGVVAKHRRDGRNGCICKSFLCSVPTPARPIPNRCSGPPLKQLQRHVIPLASYLVIPVLRRRVGANAIATNALGIGLVPTVAQILEIHSMLTGRQAGGNAVSTRRLYIQTRVAGASVPAGPPRRRTNAHHPRYWSCFTSPTRRLSSTSTRARVQNTRSSRTVQLKNRAGGKTST